MITVPLINWQPIDCMPEDRRDGRKMLLWNCTGPNVGAWVVSVGAGYDLSFWDSGYASEMDGSALEINDPTHWADINPPA